MKGLILLITNKSRIILIRRLFLLDLWPRRMSLRNLFQFCSVGSKNSAFQVIILKKLTVFLEGFSCE